MDLAYLRRNPQRQLPTTIVDQLPKVYEFPTVDPATPLVPLRPQGLFIVAATLQLPLAPVNVVST
jgi:hypothetical protein